MRVSSRVEKRADDRGCPKDAEEGNTSAHATKREAAFDG
jgi:hypothetical protein